MRSHIEFKDNPKDHFSKLVPVLVRHTMTFLDQKEVITLFRIKCFVGFKADFMDMLNVQVFKPVYDFLKADLNSHFEVIAKICSGYNGKLPQASMEEANLKTLINFLGYAEAGKSLYRGLNGKAEALKLQVKNRLLPPVIGEKEAASQLQKLSLPFREQDEETRLLSSKIRVLKWFDPHYANSLLNTAACFNIEIFSFFLTCGFRPELSMASENVLLQAFKTTNLKEFIAILATPGGKFLARNALCVIPFWSDEIPGCPPRKGSVISYAVDKGLDEFVLACVEACPDLLNRKNSEGMSPLGEACMRSRYALAQSLLAKGANPNLLGKGDTPFTLFISDFSDGPPDSELLEMFLDRRAGLDSVKTLDRVYMEDDESLMKFFYQLVKHKYADDYLVRPKYNDFFILNMIENDIKPELFKQLLKIYPKFLDTRKDGMDLVAFIISEAQYQYLPIMKEYDKYLDERLIDHFKKNEDTIKLCNAIKFNECLIPLFVEQSQKFLAREFEDCKEHKREFPSDLMALRKLFITKEKQISTFAFLPLGKTSPADIQATCALWREGYEYLTRNFKPDSKPSRFKFWISKKEPVETKAKSTFQKR